MDSRQPKGSPRLREALGRLYQDEGPQVQEYLRRFREDPTSRIFAPLAETYRRMGRIDDAIEICLEGMSHHPDFHGGRVALARCYLDKREFALAKHELEKVVNVVPENLLAQRLLGEACLSLNENRAALKAFRMALLLSPNDAALSQKVYDLEKLVAKGPAKREEPTSPPKPDYSAHETVSDEEPEDDNSWPPAAETTAPANSSFREHTDSAYANDARARTSAGPVDDFFQVSPGMEALPDITAAERTAKAKEAQDAWPADANRPAYEHEVGTEIGDVPRPKPEESWPPVPAPYVPLDMRGAQTAEEIFESDEGPEGDDFLTRDVKIEELLGVDPKAEAEAFQIEHVSEIFPGDESEKAPEITTATLGDLYYSQEQFDKALQIYEKIAAVRPGPEIEKKIQNCRVRLGVDHDALVRMRQIKALKEMLTKVKTLLRIPNPLENHVEIGDNGSHFNKLIFSRRVTEHVRDVGL